MRHSTILFALFSSLAVGSTACQPLECPEGTIERDSVCKLMDNDRHHLRSVHGAAR